MEKEHVSKWCLMMARSSYSPLHIHTQEPEAIRWYHMCIKSCKGPPLSLVCAGMNLSTASLSSFFAFFASNPLLPFF